MKTRLSTIVLILVLSIIFSRIAFCEEAKKPQAKDERMVLHFPEEKHLANVKQLTINQGAECYFSFDNKKFIFQSTRDEFNCDQIYTMDVDGSNVKLISTGKGRTTCGYFTPDGKRIIYASTHMAGDDCGRPASRAIWTLFDGFDIFSANPDGSDLKKLTNTYGYDAEGTISPDGKKIVFTSMRDGDLDIYTMNIDGSDVKRITFDRGADGEGFFSPDNKKIVYRSYYPKTDEQIAEYEDCLAKKKMGRWTYEIFIIDADGSNKKQLTNLNAASWAPFIHPNGKQIIFCSNYGKEPWNFDLYIMNIDGSGIEKLTSNPGFDGFPMFSFDGKKLVFESDRNSKERVNNVFISDWVE